jgi:hypothetical protein
MRIQISLSQIATLLILAVAAISGTFSNSATVRAQAINASATFATSNVLAAASRIEAIRTLEAAVQSFEFDGWYVIQPPAPRGFENLMNVPQQIGGNTKSAYGHIETRAGTDFKFTAISVSREKITFTTRSVRGISYKFQGRFLTDKPTKAPSDEVVLEGTLVKLQRGKQIASANIRLTYFPGD